MLIKNLTRSRRDLIVVNVLFFGAFFLFLRLCIGTELIYYYLEAGGKAPFFKTDPSFLRNYLSCPGGPTQYAAALFTQLCSFGWTGALCITLIALGLYFLTAAIAAIAPDSPLRIIAYLPAILILTICCRYENPITISTSIFIVAFISLLYKKLSPRSGELRIILFLVLTCLLYYAAGGAVLIFIVLSALDELFSRRKPLSAGLYILLGLLFSRLLGAFLFKLDENELYLSRFIGIPVVPVKQILEKEKWARLFEWVLFTSVPAIVLLAGFRRERFRRGQLPIFSEALKTAVNQKISNCPLWIVQTVLLFLIAAPAAVLSYDYMAGRTLQVGLYAGRKRWSDVLAVARKGPMKAYYPFCNNAVNRALYHAGRLGDEMFTYPQDHRRSDLVFCKIQKGNVIYMERAELCLELGMVNVAEQVAKEFLAGTNGSPYILKQIARINLVKGRIETAKLYLRALRRYLAYGREASDILRRLESDPRLDGNQHIQYLRQVSMNKDIVYVDYNEGYWLEELLRRNRRNKMAFEYLMAHYLLNRRLDKLVENLPRLDDFGYKDVPRHYQEAILLYIGTTKKDVDLGKRGINTEIFDQYNEINAFGRGPNSKDMETLRRLLEPKFGRTYFFYYTFGFTKLKE